MERNYRNPSNAELAVRACCAVAAIGMTIAIGLCYRAADASAMTARAFISDGGRALLVSGKPTSVDLPCPWLAVEAHNGREFTERGFDPSYTRLVSDYKPMARKMPNGQWEIQFTSEVAEDLP